MPKGEWTKFFDAFEKVKKDYEENNNSVKSNYWLTLIAIVNEQTITVHNLEPAGNYITTAISSKVQLDFNKFDKITIKVYEINNDFQKAEDIKIQDWGQIVRMFKDVVLDKPKTNDTTGVQKPDNLLEEYESIEDNIKNTQDSLAELGKPTINEDILKKEGPDFLKAYTKYLEQLVADKKKFINILYVVLGIVLLGSALYIFFKTRYKPDNRDEIKVAFDWASKNKLYDAGNMGDTKEKVSAFKNFLTDLLQNAQKASGDTVDSSGSPMPKKPLAGIEVPGNDENEESTITTGNKGNELRTDSSTRLPGLEDTSERNKQDDPFARFIYFREPAAEGGFDNNRKIMEKSSQTLYTFILNANGHKATFRFDTDPANFSQALSHTRYKVEPVCNIEGMSAESATKITSLEDGEAELRDNKWIVTKKATVRYS